MKIKMVSLTFGTNICHHNVEIHCFDVVSTAGHSNCNIPCIFTDLIHITLNKYYWN